MDRITTRLEIHAADVFLYKDKSIKFAAKRGFKENHYHDNLDTKDLQLVNDIVSTRKIRRINDLNGIDTKYLISIFNKEPKFNTYLGIPLVINNEVKGVLEIFPKDSLEIDQDFLDYLKSLATHAAIAIYNAELFNNAKVANIDLTKAYDATIEGWSHTMELRDSYTEGHSQRTAELTIELAKSMGIAEDEMVHIRRGVLLHDIGKIAIPDSILLKEGPLSPEEQQIMEKHPIYAFEFLSNIDYLKNSLDIPYYHHEKWDGSGYPKGLKGEDIPLQVRIFAVIDVWDALLSDRPYRKAWKVKNVIEYIKEQSGKHFDPQVVNAFLELDMCKKLLLDPDIIVT